MRDHRSQPSSRDDEDGGQWERNDNPDEALHRGVHRRRPTADKLKPATADAAVQISDGIWMSSGLSNAYLISGRDRRIVVNTGMGFEGPVHRALFDAVDDRPTALVVITQGHYDHVGGIGHFLEPDATTEVAAGEGWSTWKNDNERLSQFRADRAAFAFLPSVLSGIDHVIARFPNADTSQGEINPTITVREPRTLQLEGQTLELIPVRGGETRDSLVVWLPQRRICFVGNTFGPLFAHIPNLVTIRGDRYRDPLDFIDTVETVRALGADILVTGHFDPIIGADLINRELSNLRDAIQHVHDRTVEGMNDGQDVYTLMDTITVPAHLDVGENYGLTRWNVRAIWENYAGWFHARSTTELYGAHPTGHYHDLARISGGAGPIAAMARQRLLGGDPVLAIQLAEVALAADPRHQESLTVTLAAHEQLLMDSANFWERAWLTKQIGDLTRQINER